jgi:serine/threonine protein kinase
MILQQLLELVYNQSGLIFMLGSFGRVRLARNKKTGEYFAMKILKKADIIKLKQVDHVISENTILADIDHPFLVMCYS